MPYLRNSTALSHDFQCTCVKWRYLQGFFSVFKNFDFSGCSEVKVKKTVQNDRKFCLLHSISEKPCIIWLSFMVNICKMIISSSVFFIFSKFWFFGSIGGQPSELVMAFSFCCHGAIINENHNGKILLTLFFMLMKKIKCKGKTESWDNDKMNAQLYRIKCYLSCFFLFFSWTELLSFYYWNINHCYKKCFLTFPFFILSLCHNDVSLSNDRNLSKDTIHFSISFWWLVPPLLCFLK